MSIENRNLVPGTRLVGRYQKRSYGCTVQQAEDGDGIVFVLEDGRSFTSTSAAATAITGVAQNGWRWWSLADAAPATDAAEAPKLADTAEKLKRGGRKPKAAEAPRDAVVEAMPDEPAALEADAE